MNCITHTTGKGREEKTFSSSSAFGMLLLLYYKINCILSSTVEHFGQKIQLFCRTHTLSPFAEHALARPGFEFSTVTSFSIFL
jgi:hypothetical protein